MKRLRMLHVVLQPVFVVDDGDDLTPLPVAPITIPAAQWANVVETFADGVAALREQIEGADQPPD